MRSHKIKKLGHTGHTMLQTADVNDLMSSVGLAPGTAPMPNPAEPGAPTLELGGMLIGSEEFCTLFYNCVRYTTDLSQPAEWPSDDTLLTESGQMETLRDLWSVATTSDKGMYDLLWIMAKLNEHGSRLTPDPDDGSANPSLVTAWTRISEEAGVIQLDGPDTDGSRPQPVANCLAMLLLYQASGTLTGKGQEQREQTMISKASLNPPCKNSSEFYQNFSRFPTSDWLSALATDVLFNSAEKVQRYFESMGPLTKKYLTSHSSAGSGFFERIGHLLDTLGLRDHSAIKVYRAFAAHDLVPAFAVAHVSGSFAATLLEGPLFLYTLWRLSGLIAKERATRRAVFRTICAAFDAALDQFKEGEAKSYRNAFGRTLNSNAARERLKDKMATHAVELNDPQMIGAVHSKIAGLDCTPLRTTSQPLTRETVNSICNQVGAGDPNILAGEDLTQVLRRVMSAYLARPATTRLLVRARSSAEDITVLKRFRGLSATSDKSSYTDRFFELFRNHADNEVALAPDEEDDVAEDFFGRRTVRD